MAKVADVKLSWKKSPSADVKSVKIVVTNDGTETTTDLGAEVEEFMVVVAATKACSFKITTTDNEGLVATSVTYTFVLGDLEAPLPATDLKHEVVAVRDVNGGTPPPVGGTTSPTTPRSRRGE
jgi:hypothetical protein